MYKLQAMKGKALSIAFAGVVTLTLALAGFVTPAHAATETEVLVTADAPTNVKVTVPLSVIGSVDQQNDLTFSAPSWYKIENTSNFAVKVDNVEVKQAAGFTLEDVGSYTPAINKLAVGVSSGSGISSLHQFAGAPGVPVGNWTMSAANNNTLELDFSGQAFYADFTQGIDDKVFDIVWTFVKA